MSILKAIITATDRHKRIILEGIETKEQVDVLKELDAIGQGYFFGRPISPEQMEQKMKQIEEN